MNESSIAMVIAQRAMDGSSALGDLSLLMPKYTKSTDQAVSPLTGDLAVEISSFGYDADSTYMIFCMGKVSGSAFHFDVSTNTSVDENYVVHDAYGITPFVVVVSGVVSSGQESGVASLRLVGDAPATAQAGFVMCINRVK